VTAGNAGVTVSTNSSTQVVTVSHGNTSNVTNSSNSGNVLLQSITFDDYGHVQAIGTKDLTLADLGGDNYDSWIITDGTTSDPVHSLDTVLFTGSGSVGVSYSGGTVTITGTDTTYTSSVGIGKVGNDFRLAVGRARDLHLSTDDGILVGNGNTIDVRTITAGTGISVTNGDGIAGNPVITNTDKGSDVSKFRYLKADAAASYEVSTPNDTIEIEGGDGVETTLTGSSVSVDVDSTVVRTSGNQTINGNKTFGANASTTDITTFNTDVVFTGNITQSGNLQMTQPEIINTEDNLLFLNHGYTGVPADDAGFLINRGTADTVGFIYDESENEFAVISTTDDGTGTGNINVGGRIPFKAEKLRTTNTSQLNSQATQWLVLDNGEVKYRSLAQLINDVGSGSSIGTVTSIGISSNNSALTVGNSPITTSGTIALELATATTVQKGVVELATLTETRGLADSSRAVTPASLQGLRAAADIGDGTNTSFALVHNLGTRDVIVQIYDNSTYDTVFAHVTRNTVNEVTVDFNQAPGTDEYRVLIYKI